MPWQKHQRHTHTWGGGVGVSVFYGIYLCLCLALYLYAVIRLGREDKVCHCHVAFTVKGLYTASVNKDAYLAQLAVCRSCCHIWEGIAERDIPRATTVHIECLITLVVCHHDTLSLAVAEDYLSVASQSHDYLTCL